MYINKLEEYYLKHDFGIMTKGKNPEDFAIEAIEDCAQNNNNANDIWNKSKEWKKIVTDLEENKIRPLLITPLIFDNIIICNLFFQTIICINLSKF